MKPWQYDEFRQTGIDFQDDSEVSEYDEKYKGIRDYDAEVRFITQSLDLTNNSSLLEIGTGTGEHAIRLSGICRKVTACDISAKMLRYASVKAVNENILNIDFIQTGFLSLPGVVYDAVLTQLVLHHLPDFWKSAALRNVNSALKPGGKLFLLDSILSLEIQSYENTIDQIIETARTKAGDRIADEIVINIRDEYPTYDWVIEEMLSRTGFNIINKVKYSPLLSAYIAQKP